MQHDLKCYPNYFEALKDGSKTFECRYNDRDFKVGDELLLREYDPKQGYTTRCIVMTVTYVLSEFIGLKVCYSVLSQRTLRTCFNSLCDEYGHISLLDF